MVYFLYYFVAKLTKVFTLCFPIFGLPIFFLNAFLSDFFLHNSAETVYIGYQR